MSGPESRTGRVIWQKKLPSTNANFSINATWAGLAGTNGIRPIIFEWTDNTSSVKADFFPYSSDNYAVQFQTSLSANSGMAEAGILSLGAAAYRFVFQYPSS